MTEETRGDVRAGATDLAWQEYGSGPTVVMIHGICHRAHAWDAVVPLLARDHRVVTLDLPGHGDSPPVTDRVDPLGSSLRQVERFCAAVTPDGQRPHVVGNSLGGWMALRLGLAGHAASVTAISPAGFFRGPAEQTYALEVFRGLRALSRPLTPLLGPLSRSAAGRTLLMGAFSARPWRWDAAAVEADARALPGNRLLDRELQAAFDFPAPTGEIPPTTVLWGTRDLLLPVWQSRGVAAVVPGARVVRARGLGHVPMPDDPEQVARVVRDTVARG